MTLTHILVLALASLPIMWLVPARWRSWGLLAGSIVAFAWLLDDHSFAKLDFLLLAATVILTVAVWWVVQPPPATGIVEAAARRRDNRRALLIIGVSTLTAGALISLSRAAFPPLMPVLPGIGLVGVAAAGVAQMLPTRTAPDYFAVYRRVSALLIAGVVLVLVVLKVPALARFFGLTLAPTEARTAAGVSPLAWLGFSYIAFRLIAVLLDYRAGHLSKEGFSLREMAVYVLFFPALTAGPIDRAQRFIPELLQTKALDAAPFVDGVARIMVGVFKKFIIADSLALAALGPVLIERTDSAWGLWLLLYLYAFRIFFDFSGYSDVAIGLGKLYGLTLPENFDRPYLQQNLQQFWQRWHMTLSAWFRSYYFLPLSRLFIRRKVKLPQMAFVLVAQLSTMLLIGLWHGVTLNFAIWGLWHGVGLFAHKLLADNTRAWYLRVVQTRWKRRLIYAGGVFATFHYVALGWVFFALPEPADSLDMLARLFGLR